MRAMRGKENNENNEHHDNEHERPMNVSKGSRGTRGTDTVMGRLGPQRECTFDPPDWHQNRTEVLNTPQNPKFLLS